MNESKVDNHVTTTKIKNIKNNITFIIGMLILKFY